MVMASNLLRALQVLAFQEVDDARVLCRSIVSFPAAVLRF